MKKILSNVIAAALVVSTFSTFGAVNTVNAFTVITDARDLSPGRKSLTEDLQTAMKKNAEAVSEYIGKAEITNDITMDELTEMVFEACRYSAHEDYGASCTISKYNLEKATSSKEGSLKATILVSQDDVVAVAEIDKSIPKLEYGSADEDVDEEIVSNVNLGNDFDYKTAFDEANKAIHNAMSDFEVSNDTTKSDIIKMAQDALPKGSKVIITIKNDDFSLLKATTTVNGTLSATLTLTLGTQTKRIPVAKTINEVVNETSSKIDADRKAVNVAIDKVPLSNRITKEEILNAVLPEVKNGTQVTWKAFSMKKATFSEKGEITASLKFVLGEEERTTELQLKYPMLERKVPTDKLDKLSVNADEWNILRISNNARAAAGVSALSMIEILQQTADVREGELLELYSHTRPNGEKCFTALPSDYKYVGAAENIAQAVGKRTVQYSSDDAANGWINSPGHYTNMINGSYAYAGMGFLSLTDKVVGVQMFTGGAPIETVETSAGTMNFYDTDDLQKEYLICTAKDGMVSYLPLDIEQMEKVDGGYKLSISNCKPVIFTIGEENNANTNSVSSFSDVSEDSYYADAVKWAVENNVTTGTSEEKFSPDDTCTRAQILTFMWRALGSPEPAIANPFVDVNDTDYYAKAAVWAYEKGMVTETKFEADTPCRRSDTMKYFWLYAGSPSVSAGASFDDVSSDSDCFSAVNWAVANGITSGTSDTTFSPELICSRAEIVTFLLRAIDILR